MPRRKITCHNTMLPGPPRGTGERHGKGPMCICLYYQRLFFLIKKRFTSIVGQSNMTVRAKTLSMHAQELADQQRISIGQCER